eukprot:TRINITY_DN3265_c0_g1_i1.p1 TRINITY_DN3265_c0_g1~~TRINITY_DN3265_c0_g1_i1.p1  ORF type:complete len:422 (+),score=110.97 TRINITY_DN3265_c0_g1_i1:374-1639(+)
MDGKLAFADFLSLVLPLDNSADRVETVKREIYPIHSTERLPEAVERNLTELLKREMEYNESVEAEKAKLVNLYDYRVEAAFKAVDKRQTRCLTFDSIYEFLLKMKVGAEKEDVIAFIRRVDCDLDRKISFTEFASSVSAKMPKSKLKPSYISPTASFKASMAKTKETREMLSGNSTARSKFGCSGKLKAGTLKETTTHKKNSTVHTLPKKPPTSRKSTKSSFFARNSVRESLNSTKRTVKDKFTVYELIEEHLDMERRLELMKQDLVVQDEATLPNICHILDPDNNGYVQALGLLDVLRGLKLGPDRMACYLLFDRFDKDLDGKWEYEDVRNLVNPVKKDYSEILAGKEESKKKLGKDSMVLLNRLLRSYLDMELTNSINRTKVDKMDVKKMFEELDMNKEGFFTLENVVFLQLIRRSRSC